MIYYHSSSDMSEVKDKSIQLVATSPPYPMIAKWDDLFIEQRCLRSVPWKSQISYLRKTFRECYRVLIDGGICCVNIGDATRTIDGDFCCYPNYAGITIACMELGFTPLIPIFWKKISNRPNAFLGSGFQPVNVYVSQDIEYIGIFRKGPKRVFSEEEKIRRKSSSFTKEERNLWFQQIWEGIPGAKGSKKSSSWNMEIPYRLMRMFSIEGDTVLDPFCGKIGGKNFEEMSRTWGRDFVGFTLP